MCTCSPYLIADIDSEEMHDFFGRIRERSALDSEIGGARKHPMRIYSFGIIG